MASMASTIPAYLLPGVPVYQPAHLEGDQTFATEILPGPPSLNAIQNPLTKRDPRKDPVIYSYLPASDPGTTYSGAMHGTWIGQDSSKSKRAKLDKGGSSGRAQRASARNQNGSSNAVDPVLNFNSEGTRSSQPPPPSADDSDITIILDDEPSASHSDSSQNILDPPQSIQGMNTRGKKKDKGKGKETEVPARIKEEPQTVSLHSPEPQVDLLNNNDHCSACRSQGALVYCDGCPRAFHLWCLDPPMESIDEGDSRWFCPACTGPKHPPRKHPPGLLAPLIQSIDSAIPTEFQLPDDIRNFFKDVGTSARGNYVDISEIKPPRLNRHGQLEERDAHRLRDRNGQPVLCFRCGTSALPESTAAAPPPAKRARKATFKGEQYEMWKNIISCDYCDLHWHLDCLDPPLSTMPSFSKKWMCPNHAEQIIAPKHRIPKQNAAPIEVTKPGQYNNGNVEIVETQTVRPINVQPKVNIDEVLINGRRYRVPERIILLDFWNKINKTGVEQDTDSRSSSPLTPLSSFDDEESSHPPPPSTDTLPESDLEVAQMLWDFKRGFNLNGSEGSSSRKQSEHPMVVDSSSSSQLTPRPPKLTKLTATTKRASNKVAEPTPTTASAPFVDQSMVPPIETLSITPSSSRRRKSNTNNMQLENGARSLRSRSKAADRSRSGDEIESVPAPLASSSKPPRIRVKLEEPDNSSLLLNSGPTTIVSSDSVISLPAPSVKPPPKKRSRNKLAGSDNADPQASKINVKQENEPPAPASKRGKKRKDRDDEAPYVDRSDRKQKPKEKRETKSRAAKSVPSSTSASSLSTNTSSIPTTSTSSSTPATPSLKIRLPRMNALGSPMKPPVAASSARSS
ncbi:hypothetical protein F5878DRAFT_555232 [Lentinula raphanica]|uniref:PHD-type domain-containing protein n=1 Tax=Lentinula raphanica TaxID=153919 RepID=A0AA38PH23_9AGAR|nr:hypothetical protein F5878DRAFT_555232 [Lentinula raphanica]